jgi:phospholipid-binding lipoprotein MlaA
LKKRLIALLLLLFVVVVEAGCAGGRQPIPETTPEIRVVYDPWEPMNRHIYRFNANFDKFVFLPVVRGYRFILPQFVRTGLSNIFSNLGEPIIIVNSMLQFAPIKTAKSVARLTVNSTVGIVGIFDVARHWKLPGEHEDFGQTLGFYGLGPGPYLVLPLLGPSSLRDTGGLIVDRAMVSIPIAIWAPSASPYVTGASLLEAIQTRDDLSFRYGELGPFEYNLIRGVYLAFRKNEVLR